MALHAVGDEVVARTWSLTAQWRDAIVREIHGHNRWVEYKVSFRKQDGEWGSRLYWAEVRQREAAS